MTDNKTESPKHSSNIRWGWGRYCLFLLSLPILYLIVAAVVVPSEWANRHNRNLYEATMGYGDQLHGVRCDIIIYGDSTAMVGVDPAVLQKRTGMTACNISEFEGATTVLGTGLVDSFLAHNPRPKFVVFVYTAENFTPQSGWTGPSKAEAIVYAMRMRRNWHTLATLLRHPQDTFGVLESGLRYLARDARKPPLDPEERLTRTKMQGRFPLPDGIATRCPPAPPDLGPFDPEWIAGLRRKYEVDGTRVLVFASPDPPCEPTYADYVNRVRGVSDNGLEIYPMQDFSDVGRLHLRIPGIERFSTEIADHIQALSASTKP